MVINLAIFNVMESLVQARLDTYLKEYTDVCSCENCMDDMMCICLNDLKPRYVSTPKGELFSKVDNTMIKQQSVDIDFAVLQAIKFVSVRPRHNDR